MCEECVCVRRCDARGRRARPVSGRVRWYSPAPARSSGSAGGGWGCAASAFARHPTNHLLRSRHEDAGARLVHGQEDYAGLCHRANPLPLTRAQCATACSCDSRLLSRALRGWAVPNCDGGGATSSTAHADVVGGAQGGGGRVACGASDCTARRMRATARAAAAAAAAGPSRVVSTTSDAARALAIRLAAASGAAAAADPVAAAVAALPPYGGVPRDLFSGAPTPLPRAAQP